MSGDFYATAPRRGVALVICNENFDPQTKLGTRRGAATDLYDLNMTFAKIGYEVRSYMDLKARQILKMARNVAAEDLSLYESLVVAISTHGAKGTVPSSENYGMPDVEFLDEIDLLYGTDAPFPVELLVDIFSENRCLDLVEKPKLFFFQACRGDQFAETVRIRLRGPNPTPNYPQTSSTAATSSTASQHPDGMSDGLDARVCQQPHYASPDSHHNQPPADALPSAHLITGDNIPPLDAPVTVPNSENHTHQRDEPDLSISSASTHAPVVIESEVERRGESNGAYSSSPEDVPLPALDELLALESQTVEPGRRQEVLSKKVIISRDYLTMWSCPPGYFAFHRRDGSPFIHHLCQVLSTRHTETDLLTMLTEVNLKVSTEYECQNRLQELHGRHIVPSIEQMLRKLVCLHPKRSGPCQVCGST